MRTVRHTSRFQRDYKREKAGRHGKTLDAVLMVVVDQLADDATLKPDLILICRKPDAGILVVRVGSHSELGL